jgi:ABC-type nitrate/sulfonate/bicarbonate transport systems, periplasmic components
MKQIVAATAIMVALVLTGFGIWYFMSSLTAYSGTTESIIIEELPYESYGLIYIAEEQGLFARNGLNVTMRNYGGPNFLNGLLSDEVDIGLSSEYVFVRKVFNQANISVIGNIDRYQNVYLIGRKDKGIEKVSDLSGKKIGLTRNTISEFYLGRFLDLHGMSIRDVTLSNMPPSQYMQAITNGSIEALLTGNFIDQIQEQLGNNAVLWPTQNGQNSYYVMSCRSDWAAGHPVQINRFLKSLAQAEDYMTNHPNEAKAIVQKRLNYTDAYMAKIWPKNEFSLTLDQSLVVAMEDEGRWMIANNLTTAKTIPDIRDHIYTKGLEGVLPESVNVIA